MVSNFDAPMHVDNELTENLIMEEVVHEEEHKRPQVMSNHFYFYFLFFFNYLFSYGSKVCPTLIRFMCSSIV